MIRPATPADVPALARMAQCAVRDEPWLVSVSEPVIRELVAGPDSTVLLVEDGVLLAGEIAVRIARQWNDPRDSTAIVLSLYLEPSRRGKGRQTAWEMLKSAELWATRQAARRIAWTRLARPGDFPARHGYTLAEMAYVKELP